MCISARIYNHNNPESKLALLLRHFYCCNAVKGQDWCGEQTGSCCEREGWGAGGRPRPCCQCQLGGVQHRSWGAAGDWVVAAELSQCSTLTLSQFGHTETCGSASQQCKPGVLLLQAKSGRRRAVSTTARLSRALALCQAWLCTF